MTSDVRLMGVAGAPGIAIGPVWRFDATEGTESTAPDQPVPGQGPEEAIRTAAAETGHQLDALAGRLRDAGREPEAAIFDAQSLMALDPTLLADAVRARAPPAIRSTLSGPRREPRPRCLPPGGRDSLRPGSLCPAHGCPDLSCPAGRGPPAAERPIHRRRDDLPPSVTAEIPPGLLLGIALAGGSRTAHAVILARSLGIPAIVGIEGLIAAVDEHRPFGAARHHRH